MKVVHIDFDKNLESPIHQIVCEKDPDLAGHELWNGCPEIEDTLWQKYQTAFENYRQALYQLEDLTEEILKITAPEEL